MIVLLLLTRDLSGWDVSSVTDMLRMFSGVTLSTANYDALLRGWSALLSLQRDVSFDGGNSKYCTESARNVLINTYNWTITDGRKDIDENCRVIFDTIAFVTTWEVTAGSLGITIPTNDDFTYSYMVDWGDGSEETTIYTGDSTHTYTNAGTYTVSISDTFPSIYFNAYSGDTNSHKIKTIKQWGDNRWKTMNSAFHGCRNLTIEATAGKPNLSNVTDMAGMFGDATAFDQNISGWDVSSVTNMRYMFSGAAAFNQDINGWDVSSVTDMGFMFSGARAFNQDINGWDVSSVTDTSAMFSGAAAF